MQVQHLSLLCLGLRVGYAVDFNYLAGFPAILFGGLAIKNKEAEKEKAYIAIGIGILDIIIFIILISIGIRE